MSGLLPDEQELTRAAMAGDQKAFGLLVARHQASIRALGRRLSRSVSDGDDIAQAALLNAWRRRSTWRGGSFRGWVCMIAYREFLAGRKAARSETELEDHPGASGESGERLDLMRAISALDESERAAIALCIGAGLSHADAALAMQAPLGSVKSWVLRGRAKLQKALAAYERA
ncbi:MAG: RNA polymerase sigma factor [Hyphomonadaceae bacterium]|nr:RNA polymerase sigma factor [Hyphomonadaceae bacterium]